MDPNAALSQILAIVRALYDADTDSMNLDDLRETAENGCMLAEHVKNLDDWIVAGGFLPSRWKEKP